MSGRRFIFAASLALFPSAATSQDQPAAAAPPSLMIVEFPEGTRFAGFPRRCPDDPGGELEANSICQAELYQGRAQVVRHLSGPRLERRAMVRLTAHARPWPAGVRLAVATLPFRDGDVSGHYALWWRLPEANGDFCEVAGSLRLWDDGPVRRAFESGYRRTFQPEGYLEAEEFRCIRG